MKLIITPQEYFNNPFHFQFETYDLLRFPNKSIDVVVNEFIDDDMLNSYNLLNKTDIQLHSNVYKFTEYDLLENFKNESSYRYFVIDWYFIYSKLSIGKSEEDDSEIEFEVSWIIEEIFDFLSPNNTFDFRYIDFHSSYIIVKLNRVARDINDEPVEEEKRKEYCELFKEYKNLEPYDSDSYS